MADTENLYKVQEFKFPSGSNRGDGKKHYLFGTKKSETGETECYVCISHPAVQGPKPITFEKIDSYEICAERATGENSFEDPRLILHIGGEDYEIKLKTPRTNSDLSLKDCQIDQESSALLQFISENCTRLSETHNDRRTQKLIYKPDANSDPIEYISYDLPEINANSMALSLSKSGAERMAKKYSIPEAEREEPPTSENGAPNPENETSGSSGTGDSSSPPPHESAGNQMTASGFITNQVTVKTNEGEQKLEQVVRLNPHTPQSDGATTLFSFSNLVDATDADGSATGQQKQILNIEKRADNSYCVRIKQSDLFINENGENLESLGLKKDGDDFILEIDPTKPSIYMNSKGEELVVEVESEDGQVYKVSAGATGIDISYGEKAFSYKTDLTSTISTDIDSSAIEEFLDKNNTVCKTPAKLDQFPNYLIGLFASSINANDSVTFGDYQISKIDLSGEDEEPNPYLFVTKTNSKNKTSTYLFANGKFQKCNNYLLQYEKDEDGNPKNPSIVLEVTPSKKNTYYYAIPLNNENGNISAESQSALAIIDGIAKEVPASDDWEHVSMGEGENQHNFYIKDQRNYMKDYEFVLKPTKIVRDERTAESEAPDTENMVVPPPPENEGDEPQETAEPNNEQPENPEQPAPPAPTNNANNKPKEIDFSKTVEATSGMAQYAGLFLMAGAVLAGPLAAVLAPLGFAIAAGGTVLGGVSDLFKFKVYKKAQDKVRDYENIEFEEISGNEQFLEDQNDMIAEDEQANELESQLAELLQAEPFAEFSAIYDEYGVGFEADLDFYGDQVTRSGMLCGEDGYITRQQMLAGFKNISSASSIEARNISIEHFIANNFYFLPEEKTNKIKEMFATQNQPQIKNLVKLMTDANNARADVQKQKNAQIEAIARMSDNALLRLAKSKEMTSEQRVRFFENYSHAIIKRYSLEDNYSDAKLTALLAAVPATDREMVSQILEDTAKRMEHKIVFARKLASETKASQTTLEEVHVFGKNIKEVAEKPDTFASKADLITASTKFMQAYDFAFYKEKSQKQNLAQLQAHESELTRLNPEGQNVAHMINGTVDKAGESDIKLQASWKAIYDKLDEKGVLTEVAQNYSLAPSLYGLGLNYKRTLLELAKKQNDPELSSLVAVFEDQQKQSSQNFQNQIPGMLSTIESELATYGITVDKEIISQMQTKIKTSFIGDNANQERIAIIKAQIAQKIKEIKAEKTPDNQPLLVHLSKVDKFVDQLTSGGFSEAKDGASILSAMAEIAPELASAAETTSPVEIVRKLGNAVKIASNGLSKTQSTIEQFASKEDQNQIKALFDVKVASGLNASQALEKAMREALGDKQFEPNSPTYQQLLEQCTKDGKIELKPLSKEIDKHKENIKTHSEIELTSASRDLGSKLAEEEYREQYKSKNPVEETKYDSVIELLVAKTNKSEDEVIEILQKHKKDVYASLAELGIDKKTFDKEMGNVRTKSHGRGHVEAANTNAATYSKYQSQLQEIEAKWNNPAELKALLQTEAGKSVLSELKIDVDEVVAIIDSGKPSEEIVAKLEEYNKAHSVFKKMNKRAEETQALANREGALATLSSKKEIEVAESELDLVALEAKVEEFKTKLDAVTTDLQKAGYDQATINAALNAFATCDEAYFLAHPEIKINEPFFFSDLDDELFKSLKIDPKNLTLKNKAKVLETITKQQNAARTHVQNLREKAKSKKQEKQGMGKKARDKFEDRVHFAGKVLEKINEQYQENSPTQEQTARDRYINASLVHDDEKENEN